MNCLSDKPGNLEKVETAGFSRFSTETWKTWKNDDFQVSVGADSKRAHTPARVKGISLRERYLMGETGVSAKTNQRPCPSGGAAQPLLREVGYPC